MNFKYHERVKSVFAEPKTGKTANYGNIILKKSVVFI